MTSAAQQYPPVIPENALATHPALIHHRQSIPLSQRNLRSSFDGSGASANHSGAASTMAQQYISDKHMCSGWLYKRGKRKTWKKRWFVLRDSQLTYYKDDKEYKPKDIISTSDIMAVAMLTNDNKPNHFAFFTPSKNYHLRADTTKEAESWVEKLKVALDYASQKALSSSFIRLNVLDSVAENNNRNSVHAMPTMFKANQPFKATPNKAATNLLKRHSINGPVSSLNNNLPRLSPQGVRPSFDGNTISNSVDSNTTSLHTGSLFSGQDAAPSSCASDYGSLIIKKQPDFNLEQRLPQPPRQQQPINDEDDDDDDSFIQEPIDNTLNTFNNPDTNISPSPKPVQNILETGFLLRLKRRYKQWRNQYVVLTNGKIEFYKNERSKNPLKVIPIEDLIDVVELDAISKSKQFCMQLITPEKRIKFCAQSEDDLIRWLAAIKAIIDASPSTATIAYDLIEEEWRKTTKKHYGVFNQVFFLLFFFFSFTSIFKFYVLKFWKWDFF